MYHSLLKSLSYRANMLHCLYLCVIVAVSLSAVQATGKKWRATIDFPNVTCLRFTFVVNPLKIGGRKMQLPEKLTGLRKQKGFTQANLAEALHVSRQAISRWEVGTAVPSTDNLKVLSALYGVPVDYLLNDNTEGAATQTPSEDDSDITAAKKSGNAWIYPLTAVIAIFAVVAAILVGAWHKDESAAIMPIEDMATIVEDNFQTETFSLN